MDFIKSTARFVRSLSILGAVGFMVLEVAPHGWAQSPPWLGLQLSNGVPTLSITGSVGSQLALQVRNGLDHANPWLALTNLTLSNTPVRVTDTARPVTGQRFYRTAPTNAPSGRRVVIRPTTGAQAELYDALTSQPFIPRGANYTRLAVHPGYTIPYHSTFDPDHYEPARAGSALAEMEALGYNTIRVFLNSQTDGVGNPSGTGISKPYAVNLTDFLHRAKAHGIFVLLTTDFLPIDGGYWNLFTNPDFEGDNALILSAGGVEGQRRLWRDLIRELVRNSAPLDAILAYELVNEAAFPQNLKPFTLTKTVTAANGKRYNMTSPTERRALMDDGLVYAVDRVRAAIRGEDPTALVTLGFFWPQTPYPTRLGDVRFIEPYPAIEQSSADFVDLHVYPGDLTIPQYSKQFKLTGAEKKPIVMGEFGADESLYPDGVTAAGAFTHWRSDSCAMGIRGWLIWNWDTDDDSGKWWTAQKDGGTLARALAPSLRPDACAGGRARTKLAASYAAPNLTAQLLDANGRGLSGQPLTAALAPTSGPGDIGTFTLTGSVPVLAIKADVGLRINMECSCTGPSNVSIFIYRAAYQENGGPNRVPNPAFAGGLQPWGFWGTGAGRVVPSDVGAGRMLEVTASPTKALGLNSAVFAVTPNASFTVTFEARVPPAAVGAGYFSVVFLSATNEVRRVTQRFAPAPLVLTNVTDSGGAVIFTVPVGTVDLAANLDFAGSATLWEAHSELLIPK